MSNQQNQNAQQQNAQSRRQQQAQQKAHPQAQDCKQHKSPDDDRNDCGCGR